MKILFVTDLYPISEDEKATPRTLFDFVKCWMECGHSVDVLKPNFLFNSFVRKKKFYKTGWYKNVFNVNYFTPFWFDVAQKIPKISYDVIVAHMPSGIIFANKLDGKLICAVHNSDIEVLTNPLYSVYFKSEMEKAYEKSIGIACRSRQLKKKFLNLYPQYEEKTFLCESGINFEPILRESETVKNIVVCANLIKRKNVDKLIMAVNDLPQFNLTVIGDGKEFKHLKRIAKSNISLVGRKSNKEVLGIMRKSDIFILPSIDETFGMVYLEAMGCGCITVGIKNEGIDGIIKDSENGFLIKPTISDIQSVLKQINSMSVQQRNSILQNCYNTVKSYNIKDCANNYVKNVLQLLYK